MAGKGSASSSRGPYDRPSAIVGGGRPRKVKKGRGKDSWGMSEECWNSLVPPPPPPPAHTKDEVGPYPAKAMPLGPKQPTWAPPISLMQHHFKTEPVKDEPAESVTSEPEEDVVWTIISEPEAPSLSAAARPAFVQCVKDWLAANLSTAEFAALHV